MTPRPDDPLVPCRDCGQHHRAGETTCPHCGSPVPQDSLVPPKKWDAALSRVMYGPPAHPDAPSELLNARAMYGPPSFIHRTRPSPYRQAVLVMVSVAAVLGILLLVWKLLA